MRSTIACSVAAVLLATAGPAHADPTAAQRTIAEGLFKEGKKLLAHGQIAEACEKLASSYQIDQAGGTLLNLGACHELEGKTATAWAEFNDALAMANKAGRAERQKAAREHIAVLERKLSRVTVLAPPGATDVEVKLDGVALARGALGTGIPVDPGEHTAAASAPGKVPWERRMTIGPAESRTLQVPVLDDVNVPEPPPPPAPVGTWMKPAGAVAVGIGAAGLAVGATFGIRAVVLGGEVASACHGGVCSAPGMDDVNQGKTAATIANIMLPIGAALAGGGLTLLILSASSTEKPAAAPVTAVRAVPVLGPGVAGVQVGGAW
jgi:hypothetical protein